MRDKVRRLHELRQHKADIKKNIDTLFDQWEEAHMDILNDQMETLQTITKLEADLKQQRVSDYDGQDKSPLYGVGIREKTVLYYIETDAYNWAREHKLFLKLDTKAFEKLAKDGGMDFVTVEKQPQATIATDLSVWLPD